MARKKSIGGRIDDIFRLREKIAADQKKVDAAKAKLDEMKLQLILDLKGADLDASRGKLASVTLSTRIEPSPYDWDAFFPWMYEEQAGHLMFKRILAPAYREMLELRGGEDIPGVKPFEKESLSIRRRTDNV